MADNVSRDPLTPIVDYILTRLMLKADSYQAEEISIMKNALDAIEDVLRSDHPALESYAMISILKIDMVTDLIFHYWEKTGGRDSKHFDFLSRQHIVFLSKDPAPFYPGNFRIPDVPFLNTNYSKALLSLEDVQGKYSENQDHWGTDKLSPKRRAVILFFVLHSDLDPSAKNSLSTEHFLEIRHLFEDIDQALVIKNAPGMEYETFISFIRNYFDSTLRSDNQLAPRITTAFVKAIEYPLDKVNSKIWKSWPEDQLREMIFATEKAGSSKEASVVVRVNFDALEEDASVVKRLTPYDKRVHTAVSDLYHAGNEVFTVSQIYTAMGNTSRPSQASLKKINASLTKMRSAILEIDNSQEVEVNRGYTRFPYDSNLLPFERVSKIINGRLCNAAIHLLREPPLTSFAKERKQFTTLPSEIFEVPLNQTDTEVALEDFFIDNISRIKRGIRNPKILLSYLYTECKIETKLERSRAKDKIMTILDHYKKVGFIDGYSIDFKAGEILIQTVAQNRLSSASNRSKR